MYVKVDRGGAKRYNLKDLAKDHPEVSFPAAPNLAVLASVGVFPLKPSPRPAYHPATHALVELEPTKQQLRNPDGTYARDVPETPQNEACEWVQVWGVRQLSPEESAKATAERARELRAQRERMLLTSDWTQLTDAPVDKQAWAEYRAALRNMPQQPGFPWDIQWPVAPS